MNIFEKKPNVPMILQSEGAECGLACLAMIAGSYGAKYDLHYLRERFSTSTRGAGLQQLLEIGAALNLSCRPLRIELEYLSELKKPTLLHWGMAHFVVLIKATSKHVIIHDPATGVLKLSWEQVSRNLTGIAVEIEPNRDFYKEDKTNQFSWKHFLKETRGAAKPFIFIVILAVFMETLYFAGPFYLQWTVDWVITSNDSDLIDLLFISFFIALVFLVVTSSLRSWLILYLGTKVSLQWLSGLFEHILKLPIDFFEKRNIGDISSRFEGINQIQRVMTTGFVEAALDGLVSIVLLIAMYFYSPLLASISLLTCLLSLSLRILLFKKLKYSIKSYEINHAHQYGFFLETIRNMQPLKVYSKEHVRKSSWQNLLVDTQNPFIKSEKIHIFLRNSNVFIFGLERLILIWQAAYFAMEGYFTFGMVVGFMAFRELFVTRINNFLDRLLEIKSIEVQLERLGEIALAKPEENGQLKHLKQPVNFNIELKDVWFRYSKLDPYIIEGLNLTISKGENIAIIGKSGSGKTTLLKLILGLIKPERGEILFNGVDIYNYGISNYRKLLASVLQDEQLLKGTIAENITFFDQQVDYDNLYRCAQAAQIHEHIVSLPMQYNTLLNDIGSHFSSGQRQRILLARALYKCPLILFLDEASSHLDNETEALINNSIKNQAVTKVIVAHRKETIKTASRIIELNNGRVISDLSNTKTPIQV